MRPRERFLSSLNLKPTDRVPLFDFIDSKNLFERLTGKRPLKYEAELAVKASFKLGFDAVWIPFGGISAFTEDSESEIYVDEWGTTYKRTSYSWPCDSPIAYPISNEKDLQKLNIPDPTKPKRLDDIKTALKLTHNEIAVIGGICGPFSIAYLTMGYETLCLSLFDNPDLVIQVHEIATDFLIEAAKRIIDTGADVVYIGEDLGFKTGPFLSPSQYRRFTFPFLEKLIHSIRARGMPVLLHSDGNLNLILEDLIRMGINALNPIEIDAGMDLFEIKKKYGKRICLVGGISNSVLCDGNPEEVKKEVKRALDIASPGGGYIPCSDSGDLRDEMPLENIEAMIETIKNYRSNNEG